MNKNIVTFTIPFIFITSACSVCDLPWVGENAVSKYGEVCPTDEVGETGEEGEEIEQTDKLTCFTDKDGVTESADYCFVGEWTGEEVDEPGQVKVISASECRTLSTNTFACNRQWTAPFPADGKPSECVLCDVYDGASNAYKEQLDIQVGVLQPREVSFGLCWNPGYKRTWGSGFDASEAGMPELLASIAEDAWGSPLGCPDYDAPNLNAVPFVCSLGVTQIYDDHFAVQNANNEPVNNWTCNCAGSDSACQPGAVCEAGWQTDGFTMKPTLCTWDDGQGTSNGVAPEGPVVYGVEDWSEVTVDGTRITITSRFYAAAVLGAGLWNDDQRFDFELDATGERIEATITHCGPDSLCAHLGWTEGQTVVADIEVAEDLATGESVVIDVVDEVGAIETWTVDVED